MGALVDYLRERDYTELIVEPDDWQMIVNRALTIGMIGHAESVQDGYHVLKLRVGIDDYVEIKTPVIEKHRKGSLDLTRMSA